MYTDFDHNIQKNITERTTVLFEIERALFTKRYNLSSKHQEILWTHSISMMYSIWEGFIQTSFNLYIDELNKLNTDVYEFCDNIVVHYMENTFKQLREYPNRTPQKMSFFNNLNLFHQNTKQPLKRIVNTQSNVGFEVLNNLLQTFSLKSFPEYWDIYVHPNPNLKNTLELFLKLRNNIAHGGDLSSQEKITHLSYERFKDLIIKLMYAIRDKMLDGLTDKTFKKT